ncbi:MAG: hypothetical protein ACE5DQ_02670, partial [Candidatus Paceibacterota bacterium]
MQKFIIDTNFFFNMEADVGFGSNSREVIVNFTKIAKALQKKKRAEFYMPPRIVDELFTFVKEDEGFVQDLLSA